MLVTFNVRLPKDLMRRLRQRARLTGLPMSRIVREILQDGLGDEAVNPLRRFVGV